MTDESEHKRWWQGMPGVITAIAGLLTATAGLLALLFQYGVLGGSGDEQTVGGVTTPSVSRTADQPTTAPSTTQLQSPTAPVGKPWSEVTATFTAKDGTVTKVRAETVRYCISTGTGLDLSSGQSVPFEKMTSVQVVRSDDQFAPQGKADVVIELVGGGSIKGGIGSGCDFAGHNDLGRFSIYPQKLSRIDFDR